MSETAEERCPSCGAELPRETGQHALTPSAGIVECPTCGATVTLEKPGASAEEEAPSADVPRSDEVEPAPGEAAGEDSFAGHESVEGVMDELGDKEGGPP